MQQTQTVSSRPKLLQAMIDVAGQPDLRGKVLFTLAILVIYRFVAHVPVPGIDVDNLARFFDPAQGNNLSGMLDLFSGGALRNLSVASMGVYPYITASIVMQLLIPVVPRLQQLSREGGEAGRQRLNQITHWLTVPMAMAQSFGQLVLLERGGVLEQGIGFTGGQLGPTIAMMASMTAGTMFCVWLGELITERGIGNGISLLIFSGIVSGLPTLLGQAFLQRGNVGGLVVFFAIALITVYCIVLFTEAQRRIPVQYGRSVFRSGRMYRQAGATHIPLRVNSAGMIPIIFAFSIMIFPGAGGQLFRRFEHRLAGFRRPVRRQCVRLHRPDLLDYDLLPGSCFRLLLFDNRVPTAEHRREPAKAGRIHTRHPARQAHQRPHNQGPAPDNVGRCDFPGNNCHHPLLFRGVHRGQGVATYRCGHAHRRWRRAGYHETARGPTPDAPLRGIHPMMYVILLGGPGAGKGTQAVGLSSELERGPRRVGRPFPPSSGRGHASRSRGQVLHGQG